MVRPTTRAAILAGQSNALFYQAGQVDTGPALPYARLSGHTAWEIHAVGSTGLTEHWYRGGALYAELLAAIQSQTDKQSVCIWWIQGERDAETLTAAQAYAAAMVQFALNLQSDSGRVLDWIDAQLHDNLSKGTAETRALVRAGKEAFAASNQHVRIIYPTGLALAGDNVHWTLGTRFEMAERMYDAAVALGLV